MAVENDHNCECSVCAERYAKITKVRNIISDTRDSGAAYEQKYRVPLMMNLAAFAKFAQTIEDALEK